MSREVGFKASRSEICPVGIFFSFSCIHQQMHIIQYKSYLCVIYIVFCVYSGECDSNNRWNV
jgi:hypothetical protein